MYCTYKLVTAPPAPVNEARVGIEVKAVPVQTILPGVVQSHVPVAGAQLSCANVNFITTRITIHNDRIFILYLKNKIVSFHGIHFYNRFYISVNW